MFVSNFFLQKVKVPDFDEILLESASSSAPPPPTSLSTSSVSANAALTNNNVDEAKYVAGIVKQVPGKQVEIA
jgi:hypothetical protein